MSDAPSYVKFHIGDYLRDTLDLSPLQHGVYFLLMLTYYSTGKPLPNDLNKLCRRINAQSAEERSAVEYVLAEFFKLEGPIWKHKRIEEELSNWQGRSELAKQSAERRWEKDQEIKASMHANALPTQSKGNANQNQNQIKPKPSSATDVAFERFWTAYPRRKNKGEARKAWTALKPDDALLQAILQAVEAAKRSGDWQRDGGTFIPYPATWLRAEGWQDELAPAVGRPTKVAM